MKYIGLLLLLPMVLWVHAEDFEPIETVPNAYMHIWKQTATERSVTQQPYDDLTVCKQVSRGTYFIEDEEGKRIGIVTEQCFGYDGPSINAELAGHIDQAAYR